MPSLVYARCIADRALAMDSFGTAQGEQLQQRLEELQHLHQEDQQQITELNAQVLY